jgi:serine/threonine protein phosphatase PrpC
MNTRPALVLWGDEHTTLRHRRVEAISETAAAGISAGYYPKGYAYTDPNEDAVAIVDGAEATLLVCADGHNGFASSREALLRTLERFSDVPRPDEVSDEELIEFWDEVGHSVIDAGYASGQSESRTTLIVAIAAGHMVRWAAMGDSLLALVSHDGQQVKLLGRRRSHFVGYPMTRAEVTDRLPLGVERMADGWLILATDGLADFVADVDRTLKTATQDAVSASLVVDRLIDAAFEGGAGDNVAAAALRIG